MDRAVRELTANLSTGEKGQNLRAYVNRGWCAAERSWISTSGAEYKRLDGRNFHSGVLLTPELFDAKTKSGDLGFTYNGDMSTVKDLQREVFEDAAQTVTRYDIDGLNAADLATTLTSLQRFQRLETVATACQLYQSVLALALLVLVLELLELLALLALLAPLALLVLPVLLELPVQIVLIVLMVLLVCLDARQNVEREPPFPRFPGSPQRGNNSWGGFPITSVYLPSLLSIYSLSTLYLLSIYSLSTLYLLTSFEGMARSFQR